MNWSHIRSSPVRGLGTHLAFGVDDETAAGAGGAGGETMRARVALAVELGLLAPGERLPPGDQIAVALGVGDITVRRALIDHRLVLACGIAHLAALDADEAALCLLDGLVADMDGTQSWTSGRRPARGRRATTSARPDRRFLNGPR
ncbi:hypothetical protein ACH4SK_31520 [Streptomyces inhibens]|uniref:hypothetical protein n=1 Tax=Streptomyces inhibens TaxID=2293571 RepID=UPI00378D348E